MTLTPRFAKPHAAPKPAQPPPMTTAEGVELANAERDADENRSGRHERVRGICVSLVLLRPHTTARMCGSKSER